jgi:hypothetical protein
MFIASDSVATARVNTYLRAVTASLSLLAMNIILYSP